MHYDKFQIKDTAHVTVITIILLILLAVKASMDSQSSAPKAQAPTAYAERVTILEVGGL